MSEQLHRLDDDQLARLIGALRPPKSRALDVDRLLALAQFIAILVAGLWGLYEYLSFRRENAHLSLQQQQFSVAQQEITKQQQELALETGKIALGLQHVQSQLAEEQLAATREERHAVIWKLESKQISRRGASGIYEVDVNFHLTNSGEKQFTVIYSLVEIFLADPTSILNANSDVAQIILPPHLFQRGEFLLASGLQRVTPKDDAEITLHWRKVAAIAHVHQEGRIPPEIPPELVFAGYAKPQIGGGGTGPLRKGETADIGLAYLIRDKPTTWVGAVIHAGFDDSPGKFWRRNVPLVPPAE